MSSAIVFPRAALFDVSPTPIRPAAIRREPGHAISAAVPASLYVYGDSTPFPHAIDFIATIRAVVACGVALMKAQHAIDCARERVHEAQEHVVQLHADLDSLAESVDGALSRRPGGPHVRDVANRIASMTKGAIGAELRHAQTVLDATLARADATILDARRVAGRALGELLAAHELPDGSLGFRLFATGKGYGAEAIMGLPGGLRATFDASLPETHAWRRLRRVRDAREDVMITVPREVGVFRKRVEPCQVRLDGLTILGASIEETRGALLLGKSERSGILHAFDLDLSSPRPRVQWRDGDDARGVDLGPQDAACIAKVLHAVAHATRQLLSRRRAMTEATLDGGPLAEHDPGEACGRLVSLVAPMVREIARRSGAPGELVLRKNLDSGHRDEVFVTTAELDEQIDTLAPSLRRVFAPLELRDAPRSPRAPARSLATYEEISACEFLPVS